MIVHIFTKGRTKAISYRDDKYTKKNAIDTINRNNLYPICIELEDGDFHVFARKEITSINAR